MNEKESPNLVLVPFLSHKLFKNSYAKNKSRMSDTFKGGE